MSESDKSREWSGPRVNAPEGRSQNPRGEDLSGRSGRDNPTSALLSTPSAECLALCRLVTAARASLKLIEVQIGRTITVCTQPPSPPEKPECDYDPEPEPKKWTADALAMHAGHILHHVREAEDQLHAFLVNTMGAVELAVEGELK